VILFFKRDRSNGRPLVNLNIMTKFSAAILFIVAAVLLICEQMKAPPLGVSSPFRGWDKLIQHTPDIIVAQCTRTPDQQMLRGGWPVDINIVYILKNSTNSVALEPAKLGAAKLDSQYIPRQGEYCLFFSIFHDGVYQATETYRTVPLGLWFNADAISGRPLNDQLQILFKRRLFDLGRQIEEDQAEKERLEGGLKH
jgi:hypothetical protein